MAINLTDSLNAATTKGKLGDAKQIYLNGDEKNLQQAYEESNNHFSSLDDRSIQMENAIKDIAVTGGASTANAVTYDNESSGLTSVTAQGAIDEIKTLIDEGYLYKGIATPSMSPEENKGKVFYIAGTNGEYTNFIDMSSLPLSVEGEVAIFINNGSGWVKENTGIPNKEYVGTYEENAEFLRAYTDKNGKFLWGIRVDGTVEWAKGIPSPIQAALIELETKMKESIENGYGELETLLNEKVIELEDAIDVINASLKPLTDTFIYQDNPEFVNVITDNQGKILFGIKEDGKPYFPNNDLYRVEGNQEFLAVWVDSMNHVLFGLRQDGSTYVGKADFLDEITKIKKLLEENGIGDSQIAEQVSQLQKDIANLQSIFKIVSNDEWLHAVVDSEDSLLFGIKAENGEVVIPKQETYKIVSNDEWLAAWLDSQGKVLFGIENDGTFWAAKHNFSTGKDYDEQINQINDTLQQTQEQIDSIKEQIENIETSEVLNTFFSVFNDPEERLSVTSDNEKRILSYRDKNGINHEVVGFDSPKYYQDGIEKNWVDNSEIANRVSEEINKEDVVKLENIDGVTNHDTPNLLVASEMEKTFNDGVNSFTPPNEGYEMSNPIECQAGDWFTRTGTATGMVVVTDENDKNGTRLFNADGTTLGSTFQIPEDMTWVRYIRMAAEVGGATDGSVVICKGKEAFTGSNRGDFLTIDKLMVQQNNIPKDIRYLQTSDGRYWELYVDETDFSVKVKEVDPDIITNLPSDFKPWTLNGTFDGKFDRMLIQNNNYFIEIKATGVVKYKYIGTITSGNYANFEHFYSPTGDDRYGFIFHANDNVIGKGFTLFDGEFNILDTNIGISGYNTGVSDMHDFIYLADDHILLYSGSSKSVQVPGDTTARSVNGPRVTELKKTGDTWNVIGEFKAVDYPQLCTDAYGDLGTIGNLTDSHSNTITIDYDNNLIINCRNWDTWIKVKRTENSDGTVTLGSKTLDYNEAIIGRVGGRHNSGYLDSKRVLNDGFSFTDTPAALNEVSDDAWEEWQWFHCHDVKYWGMKNISGQNYPTYTLFDNNYWTENAFKSGQYNILNKNNNINNNPQGSGNYYLTNKDSDESYAQYTHSRVIQLSIDWENHKIMDYRVYYIPKMYSREQSGATMYDEGVISIAYSYAGEFGLWDFTTEETEVSGHVYKGAKELFHGKYDGYRVCYRANTYKLNV